MLADLEDVVVRTGEHVVQVYEHPERLALAVSSFLGAGLAEGGSALVVAMPAPRTAIERALAAAGVDVAAAREEGRLVVLDAAEVLARFAPGGRLDPELFARVVGGLLRECPGSVRVYGDMVSVLWERGQVEQAMLLETLWNDLATTVPFTLFCGYPAELVAARPGGREALRELHHRVVPAPWATDGPDDSVSHRFEPVPSAAGVARRFVADTLVRWGREQALETTAVVVGEMVGNAIRHGRQRFRVTVSSHPTFLRVAVTDPAPGVPTMRVAVPDRSTGGRGMHLIAALADRWGTELHEGGKTVWAEIDAPPGADRR